MSFIIALGVIVLGLAAGSFLNVVVFRLGSAESILWGRSHCQSCRHVLEWHELLPVASFVMLGGKCRSCHSSISLQYPAVELLTAAVFFLVYASYAEILFPASPFAALAPGGFPSFWYAAGFLYYLAAGFLILAVGLYDFRTSLIAPALIFPFLAVAAVGLVLSWFGGAETAALVNTMLAAAAAFIFFAALWFFSKGRAMGFGDAELAAALALFLGPAGGIIALLVSFWSGALYGIILMIFGKAGMKSQIPFGPFLALGGLVSLFWGGAIIGGYLSILF